jgi:hypothetical protein
MSFRETSRLILWRVTIRVNFEKYMKNKNKMYGQTAQILNVLAAGI